jgi:hypothetical protein
MYKNVAAKPSIMENIYLYKGLTSKARLKYNGLILYFYK